MLDIRDTTCVLLMSGGIESTTSLAIARERGYDIGKIIYVDYGQTFFTREFMAVLDILEDYDIPHGMLHVGFLPLCPDFHVTRRIEAFDSSALVYDPDYFETSDEVPHELNADFYTYILPYRNLLLLSYTASVLQQEGVGDYTIIYGANPTNEKPCSDESKVFIDQTMQLFGLCHEDDYSKIQIHTFAFEDWGGHGKGYIGAIKAGNALGAPLHKTTSCRNDFEYNCGVCNACLERIEAFQEAGAVDRAPYISRKSMYRIAPWLKQTKDYPYLLMERDIEESFFEKVKRVLRV